MFGRALPARTPPTSANCNGFDDYKTSSLPQSLGATYNQVKAGVWPLGSDPGRRWVRSFRSVGAVTAGAAAWPSAGAACWLASATG